MDGQRVKEWEAQCIEEQAPACTMACPLRLDVKAMLQKMKAADFAAAFKIYARFIPFPGIIGRICDHPCEPVCRRAKAGGAIRIRALEQACVEKAYNPNIRSAYMGSRPKRIAVVGAGLAGLTAALDLAMKGRAVTVFEAAAQPLERLRRDYAAVLPTSAIDDDVGVLGKLGIDISCQSRITKGDGPLGLDTLIANYDAVLLALGTSPALDFADVIRVTAEGRIDSDPYSRVTSHPKVFDGGPNGTAGGAYSPIGSAYNGRRAALSIERLLQGASLTANRADDVGEGSRLYVNVAAHAAIPPVEPSNPTQGYNETEAMAEAARCFPCRCMECVKACEYLSHYRSYPKRYIREIYNNLLIVQGNRMANRMTNSCTMCGQCAAICPNDLNMGDVSVAARQSLFEAKVMPPSYHEFGLRDMEHGRIEAAFARHQPSHAASAMVFFPGCQLTGSSPEHVERVYAHLTQKIAGGVGFMADCCGAPAHWAGRRNLHEEVKTGLREKWESLGKPEIVVACSTCLKMFGEFHPEMKVRSLWTVMAEIGLPDGARPAVAGPFAIHDPCTGRHKTSVQLAVRFLATSIRADIRELPGGAEVTTCCGFGGLAHFVNREVTDKIVNRRINESDADYLAYCAMCRDSFARAGKRAVHLLDLFFPTKDGDPAARPDPGYSRRRDNRSRLKAKLLRELWGETMSDPIPEVDLIIPEDVRADMERKLILVEEVARVVAEAEATGCKLRDTATGHMVASHKVGNFFCWVEYETTAAGIVVHRAYGHRMQVEAKL